MSAPDAPDNHDDMAWPRSNDATASETPETSAEPAPLPPQAQRIDRALKDRTPHARPLIPDEDEDDDTHSDDDSIAAPEQAVDPEVLAALEQERQERFTQQRQADPIIAIMVVGAVSIGSTPLDAVVRYVLLWALLGIAGVLAYVLGHSLRDLNNGLDDLLGGLTFGAGVGIPLLIVLGGPLAGISERMFDVDHVPLSVMNSWVFMAVVFVQPTAEALFFRGAMQQFRSLLLTTGMATLWSILLFFPHMELSGFTGLAAMIAMFFAFLNFVYSYVRFRNGLAAAWICQTISGSLIWFFPRLLFG